MLSSFSSALILLVTQFVKNFFSSKHTTYDQKLTNYWNAIRFWQSDMGWHSHPLSTAGRWKKWYKTTISGNFHYLSMVSVHVKYELIWAASTSVQWLSWIKLSRAIHLSINFSIKSTRDIKTSLTPNAFLSFYDVPDIHWK